MSGKLHKSSRKKVSKYKQSCEQYDISRLVMMCYSNHITYGVQKSSRTTMWLQQLETDDLIINYKIVFWYVIE